MESQKHGFLFENKLILPLYATDITKISGIKYTSRYDLNKKDNKYGFNLQVKSTSRKNSVCMADACRVYEDVNEGYHLLVVVYTQEAKKKKVEEIIEVDLSGMAPQLFGNVTMRDLRRLDRCIKRVPQKRSPTEEERKDIYDMRDEIQTRIYDSGGCIHLDPKCNSQQSRLQCSFNRFQNFLDSHPDRIIAKSEGNIFRGSNIQYEIDSDKRTFNTDTPTSDLKKMNMKDLIKKAQEITGSKENGRRLKKVYKRGDEYISITSSNFKASDREELIAFLNTFSK